MKNNHFINDHTAKLSQPAPDYQSYTERMRLDRQRRIVRGYHDSHLGSAVGSRGQVRSAKRDQVAGDSTERQPRFDRQAMNARHTPAAASPAMKSDTKNTVAPVSRQQFSEPQSRNYNPYQ